MDFTDLLGGAGAGSSGQPSTWDKIFSGVSDVAGLGASVYNAVKPQKSDKPQKLIQPAPQASPVKFWLIGGAAVLVAVVLTVVLFALRGGRKG